RPEQRRDHGRAAARDRRQARRRRTDRLLGLMQLEILFLAFASAFWPLLLAVAVAALASDRPAVVLGFFILGGLLTCIVEGVIIVALLRHGHVISGSGSSLDPVVYYVGAILAFLLAAIVQRMPAIKWRRRPKKSSSNDAASRLRGAGPIAAFS